MILMHAQLETGLLWGLIISRSPGGDPFAVPGAQWNHLEALGLWMPQAHLRQFGERL